MCLAIPGKILEKSNHDGALMGRVDFGGITRDIQLDFVPEAEVGDYVIVHGRGVSDRYGTVRPQPNLKTV